MSDSSALPPKTETSAPGNSEDERQKVLVVAEIGSSHGGNIDVANRLIAAAADAGADLIKFQHFYAHEIIHPATGEVPLPGGSVSLFQRFRQLETGPSFMQHCIERCTSEGSEFFCSPFGVQSAQDLLNLGQRSLKIASPELNHHPLLSWLAGRADLDALVLSSGVSSLGDMEESLSLLRDQRRKHALPDLDISLLHCITAYPSPEEEYNINVIPNLAAVLGVPTGLSDHSLDPVLVPVLAVLKGAVMVEKHFTLSRDGAGLDDPIALEPADFATMVRAIRQAEQLRSAYPGGITPPQQISPVMSGFGKYHSTQVEAILGDGVKRLAPSETANYRRSNRSIHALHRLSCGQSIGENDVAVLRTEKVLRPGLHPRHLKDIIGKTLVRSVEDGQGIVWEDFIAHA